MQILSFSLSCRSGSFRDEVLVGGCSDDEQTSHRNDALCCIYLSITHLTEVSFNLLIYSLPLRVMLMSSFCVSNQQK